MSQGGPPSADGGAQVPPESRRSVRQWIDSYERLIARIEQHLADIRDIEQAHPGSPNYSVSREDVAAMSEELEHAKQRLAYWHGLDALGR